MEFEIGQAIAILTESAKQAAAKPSMSYGMVGELQLSKSGWLLLRVPNAVVRGAFAALNEPGVELPLNDGRLVTRHHYSDVLSILKHWAACFVRGFLVMHWVHEELYKQSVAHPADLTGDSLLWYLVRLCA